METNLLFVSAIVALPAPWRRKFVALGAGVAILAAVNLTRICSLYYVGLYAPAAFDAIHLEVWPSSWWRSPWQRSLRARDGRPARPPPKRPHDRASIARPSDRPAGSRACAVRSVHVAVAGARPRLLRRRRGLGHRHTRRLGIPRHVTIHAGTGRIAARAAVGAARPCRRQRHRSVHWHCSRFRRTGFIQSSVFAALVLVTKLRWPRRLGILSAGLDPAALAAPAAALVLLRETAGSRLPFWRRHHRRRRHRLSRAGRAARHGFRAPGHALAGARVAGRPEGPRLAARRRTSPRNNTDQRNLVRVCLARLPEQLALVVVGLDGRCAPPLSRYVNTDMPAAIAPRNAQRLTLSVSASAALPIQVQTTLPVGNEQLGRRHVRHGEIGWLASQAASRVVAPADRPDNNCRP